MVMPAGGATNASETRSDGMTAVSASLAATAYEKRLPAGTGVLGGVLLITGWLLT